jgi:hypothetical protein
VYGLRYGQLGSNGAAGLSEEELEMHTIAEWKEEKQSLFPSCVHSLAYVSPQILEFLNETRVTSREQYFNPQLGF